MIIVKVYKLILYGSMWMFQNMLPTKCYIIVNKISVTQEWYLIYFYELYENNI